MPNERNTGVDCRKPLKTRELNADKRFELGADKSWLIPKDNADVAIRKHVQKRNTPARDGSGFETSGTGFDEGDGCSVIRETRREAASF